MSDELPSKQSSPLGRPEKYLGKFPVGKRGQTNYNKLPNVIPPGPLIPPGDDTIWHPAPTHKVQDYILSLQAHQKTLTVSQAHERSEKNYCS